MNTPIENALLNALLELENAVQTLATARPKPSLLTLFSKIDALVQQLPSNTDPNLLHYFHKKSHQKARLYLQGREAENQVGHCRHV